MNHFLVAAGLSWTTIRVEKRERYKAALETASIAGDIEFFARLVADAVARGGLASDPQPASLPPGRDNRGRVAQLLGSPRTPPHREVP